MKSILFALLPTIAVFSVRADVWSDYLQPPQAYADFPREVRFVERCATPDFDVEVYRQRNGPDTWQRVFVTLPKAARGIPREKLPVVIVPFYYPEGMIGFHPKDGSVTARSEKDAVPLTYYHGMTLMADLTRRGYICVSADAYYLTYATETAPDELWAKWRHVGEALRRDWPTWTGMGKLTFDTRLLIDLIERDARADSARIGIAGHSLGGKMATFAGLTDPRIKAVLVSDSGVVWDRSNWEDVWYFGSKLAEMKSRGLTQATLFDRNPKPMCLLCGEYDGEWSRELLGERAEIINPKTGVHRPSAEVLEKGYQFLDRHLKTAPREFNVFEFGAVGDAKAKDTAAIQRAIDAASAAGGGRVVVSNGWFLSGSIFLKSNVELCIDRTARIVASTEPTDYNKAEICPQNVASKFDNVSGGHLILSICQTNVAITGRGLIDGQAPRFLKMPDGSHPPTKLKIPWRPAQMIFMTETKNVTVRDVRLVNSPYWTFFLYGCENVNIANLVVRTMRYPHTYNGDGIDIDACRNVVVRDCDIDTSDDSITLRASGSRLVRKDNVCEDISVERCVFSSDCNAVRIGVGTGLIRRAAFRNCQIRESRIGVCFVAGYREMDRGADADGILFDGLTVNARQFLVAYHRFTKGATFRNVTFAHVTGESEWTSRLYANARYPFENFTFREVSVATGVEALNVKGLTFAGGEFPLAPLSAERTAALNACFNRNEYPIYKPLERP